MTFLTRSLHTTLFVVAAAACVTAGCGDRAAESAQTEPPQLDSKGAESASIALLNLSAEGCKSPPDLFVAWACTQSGLAKLVTAVNVQRSQAEQKLEGKIDFEIFFEDTKDFESKLATCLQGASQRSACLTQAYVEHGKQLTAKGGQPGNAEQAAKVQAIPKIFGAWQPDDYRSMTLAEYKAIQSSKLTDAKAFWDKRLQELAVKSDCAAPSEYSYNKQPTKEELDVVVKAVQSCDVPALAAALTVGDKVKRYNSGVHSLAVRGGCTDAVRWLVEQCIPDTYGPSGSKTPKPSDWTDVFQGGIGDSDEKDWTSLHTRFKVVLEANAVYFATSGRMRWGDWPPLNEAARSGQPDAIRYLLAVGYPFDNTEKVPPLATAIEAFRASGCSASKTIASEHCAGRLEVIKTLVGLGAPLDQARYVYDWPLTQAKKEGAQPAIDFLIWAGAKEEAPKSPQKPVDPVVARCLAQVQSTLSTTVGSNPVAMQTEVTRHAQAIRECHELAEGKGVSSDSALASVALQAEYDRFADQVAAGSHPNCRLISNDIKSLLAMGGVNSPRVIDLVETAKKHGCVR